MGKPHRLPSWSYQGTVTVFITCATQRRHKAFENDDAPRFVISDLFSKCVGKIEVTAYCIMPDHGHLLLTGLHAGSYIPAAVRAWKQATGYWCRAVHGRKLWQGNYWDHILRDPDDALAVTRYVISDPLRTGLVQNLDEYKWWGSQRWSREVLAADITLPERPSWWFE